MEQVILNAIKYAFTKEPIAATICMFSSTGFIKDLKLCKPGLYSQIINK